MWGNMGLILLQVWKWESPGSRSVFLLSFKAELPFWFLPASSPTLSLRSRDALAGPRKSMISSSSCLTSWKQVLFSIKIYTHKLPSTRIIKFTNQRSQWLAGHPWCSLAPREEAPSRSSGVRSKSCEMTPRTDGWNGWNGWNGRIFINFMGISC